MDKLIFLGYAIFMFVGAYFGYKKGSNISLFAGLGSGLFVLIGTWLMSKNIHTGHLFLGVVTGLLTFVFLMRLIKTKSFMPSGMLFGVTLIVFGYTLALIFRQPNA
ncbi:MAG: TMEM14 family protein [Candidatus Omnitrophica bacterium]|nr:TMEM14 family protein [Candidatus Omnitrophota bacterium]